VLVVSSVQNPLIPATYPIRFYIYQAAAIQEIGTASITLPIITVPSFSIYTPALTASKNTPFYAKFTSPIFLPDGFFTSEEPGKTTAYIEFGFRIINTPDSWFYYDMGMGAPTGPVQCEFAGLSSSVFTNTTLCQLIQGPTIGPTNADYVIIRVINFLPILSGS
jgi:hypothetical protein